MQTITYSVRLVWQLETLVSPRSRCFDNPNEQQLAGTWSDLSQGWHGHGQTTNWNEVVMDQRRDLAGPIPQLIPSKELLTAFLEANTTCPFKISVPFCEDLLRGYLKIARLSEAKGQSWDKDARFNEIHSFKRLCDNLFCKVSFFIISNTKRTRAFDTHVVLCESWYIGCYRLKPFEALFSSRALNHSAAHPIHGNHLKGILPTETTVRGNYVKSSLYFS